MNRLSSVLMLAALVGLSPAATYAHSSHPQDLRQQQSWDEGNTQSTENQQSGVQQPPGEVIQQPPSGEEPIPPVQQGEQQAGGGGKGFVPTTEQRKQMAELHEKHAECLRSNRPIEECRQEMQQSAQQMAGAGGWGGPMVMGPDGCPMMGGPGQGRGRGPGPGAKTPPGKQSS